MTTALQPTLFLSHGAPDLVLTPAPARAFLSGLGTTLVRPRAILVVSAHWMTDSPAVAATARPATIHDFHGFPEPLYRLRYPAPGDPALAGEIASLLAAAGLPAALDADWGLDHGAWVPLLLMYPQADLPVLQLAIQPHRDPRHHFALGRAIARLREENVLVLASGSMTHNLRIIDRRGIDAPEADWARAFADWMAERLTTGDIEAVLDYRARAPFAVQAHPYDDHLLPLFTALGAATGADGTPPRATRLHASVTYGTLRMDALRFD
ncbi:dioxygenase family protein [Parapedomonas caeni]|jgi:4,5-DOPA dioxygenase extradiol